MIAPDILKTAAAVYARLGRGADADEQTIAKALQAERERSAEVARSHYGFNHSAQAVAVGHNIALAILKPTGA